jgi:hypothetical protein
MAPGWRIDGPRRVDHPCTQALCGQTSITGAPLYNFARGTSFAAPAAAGAKALKGKQLLEGDVIVHPAKLDSSFDAHPTLLKAALVATAQSLGTRNSVSGLIDCTNGDCRPSYQSGWGLIDLERLTDPDTTVYAHNATHEFTAAGQTWHNEGWLEAQDRTKEVLIALVWNDVPPDEVAGTQNLRRDLDLKLTLRSGRTSHFYYGNNMQENIDFLDTGFSSLITAAQLKRDGKNNVEVILLPPETFDYDEHFRLWVTSWSHGDSSEHPKQTFSVYAWNVMCNNDDIIDYCYAPTQSE